MRLTANLCALALLLTGCGSNISMGEVPDGAVGGAPGASSALTGKWVGYIESYKLPSGSDVVTIEVTELADGAAAGTVVFGTKPAPPPPTNKDARYPADFKVAVTGPGSVPIPFSGEGFGYRMGKGQVRGKRFTMQINSRELWKVWCGLQSSYPLDPVDAPGIYQCLPNWGVIFGDMCAQTDPSGAVVPRDCGQIVLCDRVDAVCECTASGCGMTKTSDDVGDISFDVTFVGNEMNGSITGLLGDRQVHLTRSK